MKCSGCGANKINFKRVYYKGKEASICTDCFEKAVFDDKRNLISFLTQEQIDDAMKLATKDSMKKFTGKDYIKDTYTISKTGKEGIEEAKIIE